MLPLCLLTIALNRSWPCNDELDNEKQSYARRWNATFIKVDSWSHKLFQEMNCRAPVLPEPRNARLAKLAAVHYYLPKCRQLVFMDDTIRINDKNFNLWSLNGVFWAALDVPSTQRPYPLKCMRRISKQLNKSETPSTGPMFNSGLMVFQSDKVKNVIASLSTQLCQLKCLCFCDQVYFNALFPIWKDLLRETSVLQGSQLKNNLAAFDMTSFVHVTRGALRHRRRWLCQASSSLQE